jgi:hypothetical protein
MPAKKKKKVRVAVAVSKNLGGGIP